MFQFDKDQTQRKQWMDYLSIFEKELLQVNWENRTEKVAFVKKQLESFHVDTSDSWFVNDKVIVTWSEYCLESSKHDGCVRRHIKHLMNYPNLPYHVFCDQEQCVHNGFLTKDDLYTRLSKYINATNPRNPAIKKYRSTINLYCNTNEVNFGLCNHCIHNFIIKNDGFRGWIHKNKNSAIKCIFSRMCSINHFNIMVGIYPQASKILLQNKQSYQNIFDIFFHYLYCLIKSNGLLDELFQQYLDSNVVTNRTMKMRFLCPQWFGSNEIQKDPETGQPMSQPYAYANPQVSLYFAYEHSITFIFQLIYSLLPSFKFKHVLSMIDHGFPDVFDNWLRCYSDWPHIEHNIQTFTTDVIRPDLIKKNKLMPLGQDKFYFEMGGSDVIDWNLKEHLHPILSRFIEIVGFISGKIKYFAAKIDAKNQPKRLSNAEKQILKARNRIEMLADESSDYSIMSLVIWTTQWNFVHLFEQNKLAVSECARCNYCDSKKKQEKAMKMKRCKKCKLAWYCSRKCQKRDWNLGNHKIICKKLCELFY